MSTRRGVAVLGATGRLGALIVEHVLRADDLRLAAAITRRDHPQLGLDAGRLADGRHVGVPIRTLGHGCFGDADVVIDVSLAGGIVEAEPQLLGRPLVAGVTGQSDAGHRVISAHAAGAPVVVSSNFSSGLQVLADLVGRAARLLPDYDVEIVEAHHRGKVDAPSGSALTLASAAAAARGQTLDHAVYGRHGRGPARGPEIAIHALRMGDVVGDHEVWLAGPGDRLRLGHVATSRATFAVGALRAARWVIGQTPGHYTMRDVIGLT
jgi:4-hydroxy-tetrahydrodipicolinate reductase